MNPDSYWTTVQCGRLSFLQDGAQYFPAFVEAVRQARHSVYIAGWDVDSRVALIGRDTDQPLRLGTFLDEVAMSHPGLNIYLLVWNFSLLFAAEREPAPIISLGWKRHERVHYHADGDHPFGASHHQKFVVVDDKLAFLGGMDLAVRRWDRPQHNPEDPERVDPQGEPFNPYHDVHSVLDGGAGKALGGYFRTRWLRATGVELEQVPDEVRESAYDPWPRSVTPLCRDVNVHLARTEPRHKELPEVREVESMILETIRRAKRHLYIENQYLSSHIVKKALAERLQEKECPEILIVMPEKSGSWLARNSMDALRAKILQDLREADVDSKLLIRYPACPKGLRTYIHAKLMIADDELVTMGSANLANRSMGMDTELNLAIDAVEAHNKDDVRQCIAEFRASLLREYLGMSVEAVQAFWSENPSFTALVENLGDNGYSLEPVVIDEDELRSMELLNGEERLVDPEQPVDLGRLFEIFLAEQRTSDTKKFKGLILKAIALALLIVGGVVLWKFTGLGQDFSPDTLAQWGAQLSGKIWALPVIVAVYSAAGVVIAPVTVLVVATGLVFPPYLAAIYSLAGCLANAAITYGIGQALGRNFVRKFAGRSINELSRRLARSGILTMAVVRNLPLAPYSVVNMVAGASHIGFWDYMVGTCLGMLPGVIALTVFSGSIVRAFMNPTWWRILIPLAVIGAFILFVRYLRNRYSNGDSGEESARAHGARREEQGR
ncbi:VTT domain-containing protein [Oceanidesulfovibrio marinus]|uniref:PLD phosphodiesterase domain-containing protein n=1 Tax=Oceanidesulfovibrio marinus TaxID=370038 RepID=A0A6P1ZJ14_9BACT|nr:VTT domain-containing protein [Oceanidesulfovibrio marinus]TVM35207.1 hypothetical protein DQK91_07385 [Oceanidesulfovibrio marinus]